MTQYISDLLVAYLVALQKIKQSSETSNKE